MHWGDARQRAPAAPSRGHAAALLKSSQRLKNKKADKFLKHTKQNTAPEGVSAAAEAPAPPAGRTACCHRHAAIWGRGTRALPRAGASLPLRFKQCGAVPAPYQRTHGDLSNKYFSRGNTVLNISI